MYFDVFLNGQYIDTAYFSYRITTGKAKSKLIEDGFDSNITIMPVEDPM